MNRRVLLGLSFFIAFVGFSYFVQKNLFKQFDFDTTVRLQHNISRSLDTLFSSLSILGSFESTLVILAIILLIKRNAAMLVFTIFSFLSLHFFEFFGKLFVDHLGPPFVFLRYNIGVSFPSFYVKPGFSYPSGHAARTIFISIILAFFLSKSKRLNRNLKYLLVALVFLFDLIMLTSRVYLGEHWASDVIGGGLLGMALSFFVIGML